MPFLFLCSVRFVSFPKKISYNVDSLIVNSPLSLQNVRWRTIELEKVKQFRTLITFILGIVEAPGKFLPLCYGLKPWASWAIRTTMFYLMLGDCTFHVCGELKKIWDQPIFLQGIERRNLTSQPQRYWWRLVNGGLVLLLKKEQMEWAGVFFFCGGCHFPKQGK